MRVGGGIQHHVQSDEFASSCHTAISCWVLIMFWKLCGHEPVLQVAISPSLMARFMIALSLDVKWGRKDRISICLRVLCKELPE